VAKIQIFVSHSHNDDAYCRELVDTLRSAGADVWYDEHNLGSGQLGPTIEQELRARPVFVLILSSAALASNWVEDECRWAYTLYRKDRSRTILPILATDVNEDAIWLFLQDFKRIEAPGVRPFVRSEAIQRTLHALGLSGPAAPEQGETPEELVIRGKALSSQTKHAEAFPLFQRASQLAPSSFDAWFNLGFTLSSLGRYQEALAATEEAIAIDPSDTFAWANKAGILINLGRYQEALVAAEKVIAIDPTDTLAWANKAGALGGLGRFQEALTAVEKAIAIDPNDALAWANKAGILINLGRYQEALVAAEKAVASDPNSAAGWVNKAAALANLGSNLDALAAIDRAIAIAPMALQWQIKAILLRNLGREREARKAEAQARKLGG
jgi:tetratricopeptide (TPR) repeat protein